MKKLFSKVKATKGFTLVEMIVVMAIIGILVALLAPNVATLIKDAQDTSNDAKVKNIMTTLAAYNTKMVKDGYAYQAANIDSSAVDANAAHALADGGTALVFGATNDTLNACVQSVWNNGSVSTVPYAGNSTGYLPANVLAGTEMVHIVLSREGNPLGAIYTDSQGVVKAANSNLTLEDFGDSATDPVLSSTVRGWTYSNGAFTQ